MESRINYQEDLSGRITKAYSTFKKSPKERITKHYVEGKLEALDHYWSEFSAGHKELMHTTEPKALSSSTYMKNDLYDKTEEVYFEYRCLLKGFSANYQEVTVQQVNQAVSGKPSHVKLPEIIIPTFTGNYANWPTFRDLFRSLIHNNESLDKVQKMHYLKGHLTGEAELLLRHIPIADTNYDRCWSMLESRYNNKRYLSHQILTRMLNQKINNVESASGLKSLIDTTSECLEALLGLEINVSTWDIIVIHIVAAKLDPETRRQWEFYVTDTTSSDSLPTFKQFREFITNRFRALESLDTKAKVVKGVHSFHVTDERKGDNNEAGSVSCPYCKGSHRLFGCQKFGNEDCEIRRDFAQRSGICFICLGSNHTARYCRSSFKCRICKGRHNTLLHPKNVLNTSAESTKVFASTSNEDKPVEPSTDSDEPSPIESSVVSCYSSGQVSVYGQVLLATALVRTESSSGEAYMIRALLDQGSQASFVSEQIVQRLGLKKIPVQGLISGLESSKNISVKYFVSLKIHPRFDTNNVITVRAYVLKSITTPLPNRQIGEFREMDFGEIQLADPQYHTPNKIDILLGAEVYSQVIRNGIKKTSQGTLVAQNTSLGWILSGIISQPQEQSNFVVTMHTHVEDNDLLKRFWEQEAEPVIKKGVLTVEERKCEEIFKATTTRDKEGRYIVRLPFRNADPDCQYGNSRKIAERRFRSLEARLNKNEELKNSYKEVIKDYLETEHMVQIKEESEKSGVYLPHHAIIREDKDTTKVRVVLDASCRGENGVSLNDTLMVGPTLQDELRHILTRWRTFPVCLIADIEKMYRQVQVHKDDQRYQRILWRENTETSITAFQLTTVTFGTASAPFLAVRVLQQIAEDEGEKYPLAAKRVIQDFYMDDLMTGAENTDEATEIYKQINSLLDRAGFKLQKWSSNNEELLKNIKDHEGNNDKKLKLKLDNIIKILGLTWNRRDDAFHYSVTLPPSKLPATKRNIISDIARLYDPLGLLAPSIVLAKIIIQKLWLAGIGWDEEVPERLLDEWLTYRAKLEQLKNVKIPRWLNTTCNDLKVELHGFCDASKVAYSAVLYLRVIDSAKNVHVSLVSSKTKVAPIRQISIPRLELCGAVLLVRLMLEMSNVLNLPKPELHAWTDSEVVLAWLNSHSSRWQTFVANRVAEVQSSLDAHNWAHVQSKENPADCASRGVSPDKLAECNLWFQGPQFLHDLNITFEKPKNVTTNLEEIKAHTTVFECTLWEKYSTLSKLIRVVAFCKRFINNCKNPECSTKNNYLTTVEIKEAMNICIKKCQYEGFENEIDNLRINVKTKKDMLKSFNAFLDEKEILRVGGRLEEANLSYDRKHPILLPKKSIFTRLLVQEAHQKTLHGGPRLMLNYLNTKYWILGAKSLIRGCIRKCVSCARNSAVTKTQLMGQLPAARVTPNKPFFQSGVDYAGPIDIRTTKGRGHHAYKGYICLFICMATRAIHLEAVSDLTSQGFLAAFKRFVARRGHCADLYSDNGTNFVGAARELSLLLQSEKSTVATEIADWLSTNGTRWHFVPPHAPNFGGLWEAGIKSTKHHLKRVIGNTTLTFEEMNTVLAQIEACLNSRPLSKISTELGDPIALTPGHFLVGEPLVLVPEVNYETTTIGSLRRWQLTQKILQDFWRRWSQEYLMQFLQRHKWADQNPEPQIGDLVLVKEDHLPPCRWLMGRVENKHPGTDQVTRVVTLRTKNSIIKRPTSKLCILPITD